MPANSQTRLPERFASKSHSAQSTAFRAAPAGKSSRSFFRSKFFSRFTVSISVRTDSDVLVVSADRNSFAAADVLAVADGHNEHLSFSATAARDPERFFKLPNFLASFDLH